MAYDFDEESKRLYGLREILTYPFDTALQQVSWLEFQQFELHVDVNLQEVSSKLADPKRVGTVYLYSPGALQVTDSIEYSGKDLGVTGSYLKNAIEQKGLTAQMATEAVDDAIDFGSDVVKQFFGGGKADPGLIARVLRMSRLGSTGAGSGILAGIRAQANPHVQSVFQGVGLREFTFNFTMVPESPAEQDQCQAIIRFFREAAYPEFGDYSEDSLAGSELAWRFPNVWKIHQVTYNPRSGRLERNKDFEGRPIGHKYLTSHLKSVATTFDPESSMVRRSDGTYPSYTLTLTFQEERALSKRDIRGAPGEAGY